MTAPFPQPQTPASPPGGPVYRVRLTKVTSALVVTTRRSAVYTGTLPQLEKIARSVRTYNLLLGWWGLPWGLIRTPEALSRNSAAMQQVRALAAQRPGGAGQQWPGQPQQGQPWPAQPGQQQPWQGQPQQGQPWPAQPGQQQPWQGQPGQQPWPGQPPQG